MPDILQLQKPLCVPQTALGEQGRAWEINASTVAGQVPPKSMQTPQKGGAVGCGEQESVSCHHSLPAPATLPFHFLSLTPPQTHRCVLQFMPYCDLNPLSFHSSLHFPIFLIDIPDKISKDYVSVYMRSYKYLLLCVCVRTRVCK